MPQAKHSAMKKSGEQNQHPVPMFSFILRKGPAKNKRFPRRDEFEQNADEEMDSLQMDDVMGGNSPNNWNREAEAAFIRKLWNI